MKEISLGETTTVSTLADLLDVPAGRIIQTGFEGLGLLLTVFDMLPFERAKVVAEHFGYSVRRLPDP